MFIREEVVDAIASRIREKGFDPCFAVLVRPLDGKYQMISGHHRLEGCKRAKVAKIAAWVREMDDDEAFLKLVRGNNQGELKPLEIGLHALQYVEVSQGKEGKGIQAYADEIGKDRGNVSRYMSGASVFTSCTGTRSEVIDKTKHLYHISKAPSAEWEWLVSELLANGWSVKETEAAVKAVNAVEQIPGHAEEGLKVG